MNFPNMPKSEKTARSQMALMTAQLDQVHAELDAGIKIQDTKDVNILVNEINAFTKDPGLLRKLDPESRRNMMILAFTYAGITLSDALHRITTAAMEENFLFSDEIFDPEEDT